MNAHACDYSSGVKLVRHPLSYLEMRRDWQQHLCFWFSPVGSAICCSAVRDHTVLQTTLFSLALLAVVAASLLQPLVFNLFL